MPTTNRDLRIDFLRGFALLMIFVNHFEICVQSTVISKYTLKSIGLSDGAELFVFLSGYVFGIVYGKLLENSGYWKSQKKCLKRCSQLYFANIATYLSIAGIVQFFNFSEIAYSKPYALHLLITAPIESFYYTVILACPLFGLDLFSLYIFFLLIMVPLLYVYKKFPLAGFLISFLLYLLVQIYPQFNLPRYPIDGHFYWGTGRYFNYFAWQFMFFIGIVFGLLPRNKQIDDSALIRKVLITVSLSIITISYGLKFVIPILVEFENTTLLSHLNFNFEASLFTAKRTLGFFRIIHILSYLYLLNLVFPLFDKISQNYCIRLFISCGQNSLFIYSVSIFLVYLGIPYVWYVGKGSLTIFLFEIFGVLILFMCAMIRNHIRLKKISRIKLTKENG